MCRRDVQRRDPASDDLRREELASDEGSCGTTVVEDRRPDQETRDPARRRTCRSSG
jgi:hypothetical protein